MKLLSENDLINLKNNTGKKLEDVQPIVRLFNTKKKISFLLYELWDNSDLVCGLYGRGLNRAKIKVSSISTLESENLLQRDENFKPRHSLSEYINAAYITECLVENPELLDIYSKPGP